jgi:sporulation protein YlmC with PRC-barrel domain
MDVDLQANRHRNSAIRPSLPMKRLIWYGAAATALGLAAAMFGQDETTCNSNSSSSYLPTTKLVGRKIESSQGEEIGLIKDVVLDPSNGCMAYTVVSTGNAQTGGGKIVVVPWAVYSPTSHASTLRVKVDRDKIYNASLFDHTRMDEYIRPDYIDNVYNYYGISPGALGGVAAATDVTGTAGATTSPGEVASTTAGGTPSPNNRASTHARANPAVNRNGAATNNGSQEATRSARARRPLPTDREEGALSTRTEELASESSTSPSESKKPRRRGTKGTSTGTPTETSNSTEGDE